MAAKNSNREAAKRVFASEYNNATHEFKESEEERAPKYQLFPSGEKANRVLVVGTLTELEDVGNDGEYWQARVVDPTGTFFVYAGQYDTDAMEVFRGIEELPKYVAVVGKVDSYEGDDGDRMVSLTGEYVSIVDEETRDKWVTETASQTLDRVRTWSSDDEDGDASDRAEYVEMAEEIYGDTSDDVRDSVIEALESLDAQSDE